MPVKRDMPDDVDALMEEALALLADEEPEQALSLGRRLEKLRYSGGFEIQALAHQDMDENKKAIGVLRRGTKHAGENWILWQLFGNCLSDDEQYDEALNAYDKALDLPQSDRVSVQYNRSILLWRMERLDDANAVVGELVDDSEFADSKPELQTNIHAARMGILIDLGLDEEAVGYFETLTVPDEWSECLSEVARLDAKYAIALWRGDRIDEAQKVLARAIRHDKSNFQAQWLKREMRARDLPGGKYSYDLLIHGPWRADAFPGSSPAKGFYTNYQVVADDPEEALVFVREFEPSEIRDSLKIEDIQAKERSVEPKGVYWTSGYSFYEAE